MKKFLCLASLMVVLMVSSAQAQNVTMPGCVNQLGACGPFVNSTTISPPSTCCDPLRDVIQNDLGCLCSVFGNVELAQALKINVTEAATLPNRCNQPMDLLARCQALLAPSGGPSMSPAGSPTPALMAPPQGPSMSPAAMTPSESSPEAEAPLMPSAEAPVSGLAGAPDLAPVAGGPAPSPANDAAGNVAGPISILMLLVAGIMFF